MSTTPEPHRWPRWPADARSAQPEDGPDIAGFPSERSPEFDAVRRAAMPASPSPAHLAPVPGTTAGRDRPSFTWRHGLALIGALAVGTAWLMGRAPIQVPETAPPADGLATIVSRPEGAEVIIDGERRGVTPLRLSLSVGSHTLELRNGAASRTLPLSIDAATAVREVVDLAPVTATGYLEIRTDVPGATVLLDDEPRGVTPLTLADVAAGTHRVTFTRGGVTIHKTVDVTAGATVEVAAQLPVPGRAASDGWLTFDVPIEMQVIEDGRVLGTTGAGRLLVPAGRRQLRLVASSYGFETTATADVRAGRTVAVPVVVPNGRLSINAVPWADVWIGGRSLGPTPLANLAVPIGEHTVVLRHPELGERRQVVRLTTAGPVRVGVDFNP